MSANYRLLRKETRQAVWVGQSSSTMKTFYADEPETMEKLGGFLAATQGKELVPIDEHDDIEYTEFV